ncbi:MAG TPA: hypothetical protein VK674_05800 [Candidatus Limnocylindria bacterium]|nr:hypothetical protein [Candidatus Limnocylindria bacterium]
MKRSRSTKDLPNSALAYVLEALIPYSDANVKLAFKPHLFFNDLENIARQKQSLSYRRQTLRNAFYHAKRSGFIEFSKSGGPRLTRKGEAYLKPYEPSKLGDSARLMVIFDIPEEQRAKRRYLRLILRQLKFKMVQQSVWISKYDCKTILHDEIEAYELQAYVQIYECVRLL